MDVPQLFDDVKQKYGFPFALKKEQEEIIAHICANKNVFVLLPTGFGKSVTFLIPPLIFDEVLIIMAYNICHCTWRARERNGGLTPV